MLRSLPSLGTTAVFLLARACCFRAPRLSPRHGSDCADCFAGSMRLMQRANRLVGGFAFRTRDRALPEDDPIAWRELTRTTLGRPHYLARLLVAWKSPPWRSASGLRDRG
jgi:hypothetical protein